LEALVVVAKQDEKELVLFGEPVTSDALETAGTVLRP